MTCLARSLLSLAALAAAAPAVLAGPPAGKHPAPTPAPHPTYYKPVVQPHFDTVYAVKNYHLAYGTKFVHGYYYTGYHHNHWGRICFDPAYRCRLYWCPNVRCW